MARRILKFSEITAQDIKQIALDQLLDKSILYQQAIEMLLETRHLNTMTLSEAIDHQLLNLPGGQAWGQDRL